MNGFTYALTHRDNVVNASNSLSDLQAIAAHHTISIYELSIVVYRNGETVGLLVYNPRAGWWNVGQWDDMELMV